MIDSEKVVRRAIEHKIKIKALLATEAHYKRNQDIIDTLSDGRLFIAPKEYMINIVGHHIHQGIMALAERPAPSPLEELGDRILYLNGVGDSQNVGSMCRNAKAFGYTGVITDQSGCSIYVRRTIRVSMGCTFSLMHHESTNTTTTLEWLREHGYQIISTHLGDHSVDLNELNFEKKHVIIIGNEDQGVDKGVDEFADISVRIPIISGVDSLNAACASAVVLHAGSIHKLEKER